MMDIGSTRPQKLTIIEWMLLRHRAVLVSALILVTMLCWAWIVPMARDMYGAMNGPSAWMMTRTWDPAHLLLHWAMWVVMMVGMMLPSIAPTLLVYSAMLRRSQPAATWSGLQVYPLAGGYLLVWVLFSTAATLLQRFLTELLLLTPMMEMSSPTAAGTLLLVAGGYQLTPVKRACLHSCRSPLSSLMLHGVTGRAGAFRIGLEHGLQCLGCCWALMLLLFVGGVMNLYVIAAITAFVLLEKIVPAGAQGPYVSGASLITVGIWLMTK